MHILIAHDEQDPGVIVNFILKTQDNRVDNVTSFGDALEFFKSDSR